MAQFTSDSQIQGIHFTGAPMIVGVIPGSVPQDAVFPQVHLRVQISFGGDVHERLFAADSSAREELRFDISTALRAVMGIPDYDIDDILGSSPFSNPSATYQVSAWESYLLDGSEFETQRVFSYGDARAVRGGVSEYDRWAGAGYAGQILANGRILTRKPASVEICTPGQDLAYSHYSSQEQTVLTQSSQAPSSGSFTYAGRQAYVDTRWGRQSFLFANGFGVLENASAVMRESLSYDVEKETASLVGTPVYSPSGSRASWGQAPRARWEMSSGYVTRQWADWFATEFVLADRHWMYLGGRWVPVFLEPSDNEVKVYDTADGQMCRIDFTVTSSLSGSVLTAVS